MGSRSLCLVHVCLCVCVCGESAAVIITEKFMLPQEKLSYIYIYHFVTGPVPENENKGHSGQLRYRCIQKWLGISCNPRYRINLFELKVEMHEFNMSWKGQRGRAQMPHSLAFRHWVGSSGKILVGVPKKELPCTRVVSLLILFSLSLCPGRRRLTSQSAPDPNLLGGFFFLILMLSVLASVFLPCLLHQLGWGWNSAFLSICLLHTMPLYTILHQLLYT